MLVAGGRLGILEITQPTGALAPFYRVWFDRIVPLLGRPLTGGSAYTYLPPACAGFPGKDDLAGSSRRPGSTTLRYRHVRGRHRRPPYCYLQAK